MLVCMLTACQKEKGGEREREREREQVTEKEAMLQSPSLCRVRWGGAWEVVRVCLLAC